MEKRQMNMAGTLAQRDRKKILKRSLIKLLKEFLQHTSLHGLQYMNNEERPTFERAIWLVVCAIMMVTAIMIVSIIYNTFSNTPTVTQVENPHYSLWKIPFPAVTICNTNKIQKDKVEQVMMELYPNIDEHTKLEFMRTMTILSMMKYPFYFRIPFYLNNSTKSRITNESTPLMDITHINITQLMLRVMPTLDEIFKFCFWKGRRYDCNDLLHVQRTEEGFCYSFNSRTAEYLRVGKQHTMFNDTESKFNFPVWKNNAAGRTTGFEAMLKSTAHDYLGPDIRNKGFNVVIHHPEEIPDVSKAVFIPEGKRQVTALAVSPAYTYATTEVKRLSVEGRRCMFSDEKILSIYPVYNENNCLVECRMDNLLEKCNCTPYYLPRMKNAVECTTVIPHLQCLSDHNVQLRNHRPPPGTYGFTAEDIVDGMNCTCLPTCSDVIYQVEQQFTQSDNPYDMEAYGYVDVFFKSLGAVSYRRDVRFGVLDLMVSFGGLAGLFLGFSLLSAVEVIYYFMRMVSLVIIVALGGEPDRKKKIPVLSAHDSQMEIWRSGKKPHRHAWNVHHPDNHDKMELWKSDKKPHRHAWNVVRPDNHQQEQYFREQEYFRYLP